MEKKGFLESDEFLLFFRYIRLYIKKMYTMKDLIYIIAE